jgi:hypothetical protein
MLHKTYLQFINIYSISGQTRSYCDTSYSSGCESDVDSEER